MIGTTGGMKTRAWLALILALVATPLAAGCGSGHHDGGEPSGRAGNATDVAFVNDMVPHHEGAVEMAELAKTRAEHPELRKLADDIIAAQNREIETMQSVEADLPDSGGDHGAHMSGDDHSRGMGTDPQELRDAKPFDRAFIDMMIPHHEGAVKMAEEELSEGENPRLRRLADDIVSAQQREIAQMREWRERWYGDAGAGDSSHGSDGSAHGH